MKFWLFFGNEAEMDGTLPSLWPSRTCIWTLSSAMTFWAWKKVGKKCLDKWVDNVDVHRTVRHGSSRHEQLGTVAAGTMCSHAGRHDSGG